MVDRRRLQASKDHLPKKPLILPRKCAFPEGKEAKSVSFIAAAFRAAPENGQKDAVSIYPGPDSTS